MRIKIIAFLCIFIFAQGLMAAEEPLNKITRIALSATDKIQYETRSLNNPPRLIVKFKTRNVTGNLIEDAEINQGAVKKIEVTYYPFVSRDTGSRRIKFLTFWLNQSASYKIWDEGNKIYLDFKSPFVTAQPVEIEISDTINIKDTEPRYGTVNALLSQFSSMREVPAPNQPDSSDILWVLAAILTMSYIMWFRPEAWRRFIDKIVNFGANLNSAMEKRKWWRHNIASLKNKDIHVNIESPESSTGINLVPRDLGYGGLCFDCARATKLKGELDIKIFTPLKAQPVALKGNIAWQKNSWNPLRRLIGISFIDPPDRDWAGIHSYIEKQYAVLKS